MQIQNYIPGLLHVFVNKFLLRKYALDLRCDIDIDDGVCLTRHFYVVRFIEDRLSSYFLINVTRKYLRPDKKKCL